MKNYWYIKKDFFKERSGRIGSSDIPALVQNPEKPNESLAGYGRTPITVWQEKTGRLKKSAFGLPAEMGHYNETKAIELFIRGASGREAANKFFYNKSVYELLNSKKNTEVEAEDYQELYYKHNTQYYTDEFIVHADCIHHVEDITKDHTKFIDGKKINLNRDFIIEAKNANYWAALRRNDSLVSGYDMALDTWQGIPLKHYLQIQFQLALLEIPMAYLALIYNTSQFKFWEIKANRKYQNKIIDIAGKMAWHVKNDKAPKDMALNKQDISDLYPNMKNDFVYVSGETEDQALKIAHEYREASEQEKRWKQKKTEAQDAMSIILKDIPEIHNVNGCIAKWQETKGYEKTLSLKEIKKLEPKFFKYLKKNKLLTTTKNKKSVTINYKGD